MQSTLIKLRRPVWCDYWIISMTNLSRVGNGETEPPFQFYVEQQSFQNVLATPPQILDMARPLLIANANHFADITAENTLKIKFWANFHLLF